MLEESISDFISECAKKGKNSPEEIKDLALENIKNIDKILQEADILRRTRSNMIGVIKALGFELPKNKKQSKILIEESSQDDLDSVSLEYAIKICEYIEKDTRVSPRDLMTLFGIAPEKDIEIYSVIKWLCANGTCSRDSSMFLIKGIAWETRPVRKEIKNENN